MTDPASGSAGTRTDCTPSVSHHCSLQRKRTVVQECLYICDKKQLRKTLTGRWAWGLRRWSIIVFVSVVLGLFDSQVWFRCILFVFLRWSPVIWILGRFFVRNTVLVLRHYNDKWQLGDAFKNEHDPILFRSESVRKISGRGREQGPFGLSSIKWIKNMKN